MMASYSPTVFSESFKKMIGPRLVIEATSRMARTTTKTEQKERQN